MLDYPVACIPGRYGHSTSGHFTSIPIISPKSPGGFGDQMAALNVAKELKANFPDKEIGLYFSHAASYQKFQALFPNFDPSKHDNYVDNVFVRLRDTSEVREFVKGQKVAIYCPVAYAQDCTHEGFLMGAEINVYLEEYDIRGCPRLPHFMRENVLYKDDSSAAHLFLSTGFDPEGIGIHIASGSPQAVNRSKRTVLEDAGLEALIREVPDILESDWGVAYYHNATSFRMDFALPKIGDSSGEATEFSYLRELLQFLRRRPHSRRPVVLFDCSDPYAYSLDGENYQRVFTNEPFTDLFLQEGRIGRVEAGRGARHTTPAPVRILHLGHLRNDAFKALLTVTDLPVLITGDSSLADALSADALFLYDDCDWKSATQRNVFSFAQRVLRFTDVRNILAIYDNTISRFGSDALFDDPAVRASFRSLNQAIREKADLHRNLAEIIRGLTI